MVCRQESMQVISILALKARADVTRSPKEGYQWPHKRTYVLQKNVDSYHFVLIDKISRNEEFHSGGSSAKIYVLSCAKLMVTSDSIMQMIQHNRKVLKTSIHNGYLILENSTLKLFKFLKLIIYFFSQIHLHHWLPLSSHYP